MNIARKKIYEELKSIILRLYLLGVDSSSGQDKESIVPA
jgi:hypothetical protein